MYISQRRIYFITRKFDIVHMTDHGAWNLDCGAQGLNLEVVQMHKLGWSIYVNVISHLWSSNHLYSPCLDACEKLLLETCMFKHCNQYLRFDSV